MLLKNSTKRISLKSVLFLIVLLIALPACDIVEDDNQCEDTMTSKIELRLTPSVKIEHADGIPFDGVVVFNVYKEYCDGTVSGSFTKQTTTDPDGYANFYYTYYYDFKNTKDKVYFSYVISQGSNTQEVKGEIPQSMVLDNMVFIGIERITFLDMFENYYNEEPIVLTWDAP